MWTSFIVYAVETTFIFGVTSVCCSYVIEFVVSTLMDSED